MFNIRWRRFLKADDDTFVIVENLRYLLLRYNPALPLLFGFNFYLQGNRDKQLARPLSN